MQQVSYGPLMMSIMLILRCYTGFFNVRRGWQSLNTGPRFYLRLIRRTGWLWIHTSRTTDGRPFKPKKLSWEIYTLYTCVTGMMLHINGKFTMGKLKSSPLSQSFLRYRVKAIKYYIKRMWCQLNCKIHCTIYIRYLKDLWDILPAL